MITRYGEFGRFRITRRMIEDGKELFAVTDGEWLDTLNQPRVIGLVSSLEKAKAVCDLHLSDCVKETQ